MFHAHTLQSINKYNKIMGYLVNRDLLIVVKIVAIHKLIIDTLIKNMYTRRIFRQQKTCPWRSNKIKREIMLEIEARCGPNIPIPVTENSEFFENRSCEDLIYDYDYIIVNSCQHKMPSERNLHQQLNPFSCWLNN